MKIRKLSAADWIVWKDIRLEALQNSPTSFASSYEEEKLFSDADFQKTLQSSHLLGVFVGGLLVSCAGFYKLNADKTQHRGVLWGMYTRPKCRGQGIATALIQAIIQHAKTCVMQLHLTCVTTNPKALSFYQRQGFQIYGTEQRALKIGDVFYDEFLMVLDFTEKPMKKLDSYQNLCTEVYDLSKPEAPQDAYQFYRGYVLEAKGSILEPMCGTGRFLLPLVEEGFDVYGFDASLPMLDRLLAKAKAKNIQPTVWQGFIEDLNQDNLYSLMFIPCGSFCLITSEPDIKNALKILYDHLEEKGLLVFEIETPYAVPSALGIWRGSGFPKEDGRYILYSALAMLDTQVCTSIGKYELIEGNRVIQTEVETYKIRIYEEPGFLMKLLKSVGFRDVRLLKAFDRDAPPDKTDESIVFECRK